MAEDLIEGGVSWASTAAGSTWLMRFANQSVDFSALTANRVYSFVGQVLRFDSDGSHRFFVHFEPDFKRYRSFHSLRNFCVMVLT